MGALVSAALCLVSLVIGTVLGLAFGRVDRVTWKTGSLFKEVSVRGFGRLDKRLRAAIAASNDVEWKEPDFWPSLDPDKDIPPPTGTSARRPG